ncbi:LNS2 (Lipin/Ned1/Smp2) domain-containing protein [Ditylenchus destructor]|nr:LNS2 (Lipin/Ned1/Smp2) domain-containing protein [Ditylenchus destructor]
MDYVYNIVSNMKYFYSSMNPASLSGAIDVIVVEQPDGSLLSTPFHIRFGKYGVFNFDDKYVDIQINGEEIALKMKLGENGVAFFVEETQDGERVPRYLATSPLPDETDMNKSSPPPEEPHLEPQCQIISPRPISRRHSVNEGRTKHRRRHRRPRQRAGAPKMSPPPGSSFSDSEVENLRKNPTSNVETEWKWGEIPESSKSKAEAKKLKDIEDSSKKRNAYIWSWFTWSKRENQAASTSAEVPVTSTASTSTAPVLAKESSSSESTSAQPRKKSADEKGLYLQDIGDDPSKIAKYFGKRSGTASVSSNVDSGNGVSLGASPNSPSALSLSDEPIGNAPDMEDLTPTTEEISTALQKDHALEQELLAGTDEHASTPRTLEAAEVEAGNTAVDNANETGAETPVPNLEVTAEKNFPPKRRYDSGNSAMSSASDLVLSDDELASIELVSAEYKRSLRLSSDQLQSLGLHYGSNEARFSITTKFQGTAWCSCHIYLLKWNEQLVISDIDGTITKSDVLGHVIPAIGGTWAHAGVAELYTHIKSNGYRMIYLSSRAIGLSHHTKNYLKNVKQGTRKLPDGPVLLSPTSVLMALRKEVIERRPDEFKIACLTDLKALFPARQPFCAGFGNRPTDVKSYMAVGIPQERILIINPSGVVCRADKIGYASDYASMANDIVDYIFPPIRNNSRRAPDNSPCPWANLPGTALVDEQSIEAYNHRVAELKKKKELRKA